MGQKLYQYAVILHPDKGEQCTKVIIPPTEWRLYASDAAVNMAAIAAIGKHAEHAGLIETAADRLEVAVRPFDCRSLPIDFGFEAKRISAEAKRVAALQPPMQRMERHGLALGPRGLVGLPGPTGPAGATYSNVGDLLRNRE